ncbi:hypothetical protein IWW36_002535, partial [Coemansia brasiliensis]
SISKEDMHKVKEAFEADSAASASAHSEIKVPVYLPFAESPINNYANCESTFKWLKDEVLNHYFNGVEFNTAQYKITYGESPMEMCDEDLVFTYFEPSNLQAKIKIEGETN